MVPSASAEMISNASQSDLAQRIQGVFNLSLTKTNETLKNQKLVEKLMRILDFVILKH